AVADVAEGIDAHFRKARGEPRTGALDELGALRYRHRDVVLHVGELRLGHGLANAPQCARLVAAFRERRVDERAALRAVHQHLLDTLAQRPLLAAVGELGEDVPGMWRGERVLRARRVAKNR